MGDQEWRSAGYAPGLTVWVADEAYNGRVLKTWQSEDYRSMYRARMDEFLDAARS